MGKLTTGHIAETAVWLILALLLYAYSFEFNQNIEIYRFGATGWPRMIIGLLVLAALGNLYYHWKNGDVLQEGRIGIMVDDETAGADRSIWSRLRVASILLLPFLFAYLLKPVGFYSAAPNNMPPMTPATKMKTVFQSVKKSAVVPSMKCSIMHQRLYQSSSFNRVFQVSICALMS